MAAAKVKKRHEKLFGSWKFQIDIIPHAWWCVLGLQFHFGPTRMVGVALKQQLPSLNAFESGSIGCFAQLPVSWHQMRCQCPRGKQHRSLTFDCIKCFIKVKQDAEASACPKLLFQSKYFGVHFPILPVRMAISPLWPSNNTSFFHSDSHHFVIIYDTKPSGVGCHC